MAQAALAEQPAEAQEDDGYQSITIQGIDFQVQAPYKAGAHTLTEGEAGALNQTRAENVRNNFASTIKKAEADYRKANSLADDAEVARESLDLDALMEKLAEYDDKYEFGVRVATGPRAPSDPVGREAHRIAKDRVKAALSKKGIKIDSVSKEKMAEFIKGVLAKYPEITEEAKRRVEAAGSIALDTLEV